MVRSQTCLYPERGKNKNLLSHIVCEVVWCYVMLLIPVPGIKISISYRGGFCELMTTWKWYIPHIISHVLSKLNRYNRRMPFQRILKKQFSLFLCQRAKKNLLLCFLYQKDPSMREDSGSGLYAGLRSKTDDYFGVELLQSVFIRGIRADEKTWHVITRTNGRRSSSSSFSVSF